MPLSRLSGIQPLVWVAGVVWAVPDRARTKRDHPHAGRAMITFSHVDAEYEAVSLDVSGLPIG